MMCSLVSVCQLIQRVSRDSVDIKTIIREIICKLIKMNEYNIENDIHQIRSIVVKSLIDVGNCGTLQEIHDKTKQYVENGIKITVIHKILLSLEGIVSIDRRKDFSPELEAELVGVKEAETIRFLHDELIRQKR